jgi:hypothetical protein
LLQSQPLSGSIDVMPPLLFIPLAILVGLATVAGVHVIPDVATPQLTAMLLAISFGGYVASAGISPDRLRNSRIFVGMACAAYGVILGFWL